MRNYEVGILPESSCFSFSPSEHTQQLFYYPIWCGHYYCNSEYYIKRESYPPLLLVYVCDGCFSLELAAETYEARAGQVIFFDCCQPHYYYAKEYTEFYYIHFDGPEAHRLCQYINQSSGILIDGPDNEKIRQALADMLSFYEAGNNESVVASSCRIYSLFSLLDNPAISPRLRKNDDSINRAIDYIRSNVGKKITLQELADVAGLSIYYFSHLFKELTGQSPIEFIIYSRIDQAKVLLANTSLPVSKIAQQVGYPNSSNLITLFTHRVGCSPSQFRKTSSRGI